MNNTYILIYVHLSFEWRCIITMIVPLGFQFPPYANPLPPSLRRRDAPITHDSTCVAQPDPVHYHYRITVMY